jgi:hypothetical protein
MVDFELKEGIYSARFMELGIHSFAEACMRVQHIPFGRNSDNLNWHLVLDEKRGTCATKHALLARLAEENNVQEVELIAGIFLMDAETHPLLTDFFQDKPFASIPEMYCYLKQKNKRYDFTTVEDRMPWIEQKMVREQRIEPHQIGEWKSMLHKDYLLKWIARKPELDCTFDEIWEYREQCIALLTKTPFG